MNPRHAAEMSRASRSESQPQANYETPAQSSREFRFESADGSRHGEPAGASSVGSSVARQLDPEAPRLRATRLVARPRVAGFSEASGATAPVHSDVSIAGRIGAGSSPDAKALEKTTAEPAQSSTPVANRSAAIARRLVDKIGADRFSRCFGTADAISHEGGSVVVRVPDKAAGSLLEKRFGAAIREAIDVEVGSGAALEVRVSEMDSARADDSAAVVEIKDDRAGGASHQLRRPSRAVLGDRYRLESFIVGQSNRLAYNAALQMAEGLSPTAQNGHGSKGFSPLFLHGPCGVGKTHLLQGAAVRFKERHPGTTVRVTSGEQFMNDFVNAVRLGSSGTSSGGSGAERFRRAYRKVDLLCIDDVHVLASKQATQAELLHTFDEIERGGARIILVSDEHPRQLSKFSPALVSRFMSGMVAGMQTPDAELRDKLVRGHAAARGMVLEDGAAAILVERTAPMPGSPAPSVREIEGMLVKVEALHRLTDGEKPGEKVRVATVLRALDGDAGERAGFIASARPVRIEQIVTHTCTVLGVDTSDLGAKTRHKRVVLARAVITHLARQHTTLSYPEIARAIGRPNHSTVITAHQRLAKQIQADEPIEVLMGGPIPGEARTVAALVRQLSQSVQTVARRG